MEELVMRSERKVRRCGKFTVVEGVRLVKPAMLAMLAMPHARLKTGCPRVFDQWAMEGV